MIGKSVDYEDFINNIYNIELRRIIESNIIYLDKESCNLSIESIEDYYGANYYISVDLYFSNGNDGITLSINEDGCLFDDWYHRDDLDNFKKWIKRQEVD